MAAAMAFGACRQAFVTAGALLALASADSAPVSAYSAFADASPRRFQAACWEQTSWVGACVAVAALGVAAALVTRWDVLVQPVTAVTAKAAPARVMAIGRVIGILVTNSCLRRICPM